MAPSISEYDYHLPEELIAQIPAEERSRSRLMLVDRSSRTLFHKQFCDLLFQLNSGDALVLNQTRVIPARIEACRKSGGKVEIFLLKQTGEDQWEALTRPSSRLKEGETLDLSRGGSARLNEFIGQGIWAVHFTGLPETGGLDEIGRMPLPHYIRRNKSSDPRDTLDQERYQTVFGTKPGAVAAPTAGLHFTESLLQQISVRGVKVVKLTLHVGVGTFAPLREENYTRHRMHPEWFELTADSAEALNRIRDQGGRIVAVGTTSARVLETAAQEDGKLRPASGETRLFIYPPYRFKAVDLLLTNFHLPKSTLLLLVGAFIGREKLLSAYREAVEQKYRFYSYGDAMLLGDIKQ